MRTMLKRAPLWTYPQKSVAAEKHKMKDPSQTTLTERIPHASSDFFMVFSHGLKFSRGIPGDPRSKI
jgi:hypothetical protein